MHNTNHSSHLALCFTSPFYVSCLKLFESYKLSSAKAVVPKPRGEKGELPCYVPSLLRSVLTSISRALKEKNALSSSDSVLPLRSLSGGFCLSWKTKRFGCLKGSWLLPEHRPSCRVSRHPSSRVRSPSAFVSVCSINCLSSQGWTRSRRLELVKPFLYGRE